MPAFDVELSQLYGLAANRMAGKMSLSGLQPKVSLRLAEGGGGLEVAAQGGRFILKPDASAYPELPPNEHLTMRLAALLEIETPPCGLIRLADGKCAYLVRRFDRLDNGRKLPVEDFCQLSQQPPPEKYQGSAELCVRLLRSFATEPLIEVQKLYRLLLFGWWVANGDMHLKNLALLTAADGFRRLSPAYDLLCTRLAIPGDTLALPVGGRRDRLTRRTWLEFADYCDIPSRAAERILRRLLEALPRARELIAASYLSQEMRTSYARIVSENAQLLAP